MLDRFERQLGLGEQQEDEKSQDEIQRLLNLGFDEIRRLSAIECAEAAYLLDEYAFHLQRAINRQQSQSNWAESRISRLIASTVNQMSGYTYKEKREQAMRLDDAACETEKIRVSAQLKVDRLNYLSGRVASLSTRMSELSYVKRVRQ